MYQNLQQRGATFIKQKVDLLSELEFDFVINCCGVGARDLNWDDSIKPIRGHLVTVKAPWIRQTIAFSDDCYILPT